MHTLIAGREGNSLTLTNIANVAQIVLAVATVGGVLAALITTKMTLREVQNDRQFRQAPFLTFEPGGWPIPVNISKVGLRIPGVEPSYVEKTFKGLPADVKTIQPKKNFGELPNAGIGPALDVWVQWIPEEIKIGRDSFQIDDKKLAEPAYSGPLNKVPASPRIIAPGQKSELTRLPSFIVMDVDQKIKEVSGYLKITCTDTSGRPYVTMQSFWLSTDYGDQQPSIHVTFLDLRDIIPHASGRQRVMLRRRDKRAEDS